MTRQMAELLDLIGDLHEGVADPHSWDRGLDRLSDAFGGSPILIGSFGHEQAVFNLSAHRIRPEIVALLAGPLANPRDNPWITTAWAAPLRRLTTMDDVGLDRLRQSKIWDAVYATPVGIRQSVGALLDRAADRAEFVLFSRADAYDVPETKRLTDLLPHLARAWRVRNAIARWEQRAADMAAALDRLDRGVIVTDAEGKVRYANRAADALLGAGDAIDATRGRLRGARPADSAALTAMIDRATQTGIGRAGVAVDALTLPRAGDGAPLAVVAEPLSPAHGDRLGQTQGHGAILFLSDAASSSRPSAARVGQVYHLTPAEAQVAARIADGAGVAAVAADLGISENTVKTHLKAVFEKVGVTRQVQLVRRIIADVGGLANESLHGEGAPSSKAPGP